MNTYYQIITSADEEARALPYEGIERAGCTACGYILPSYYPHQLRVLLTSVPKVSALGVMLPFATVYRSGLLASLRPHLAPHKLGPVYVLEGHSARKINSHVTCYGRFEREVILRGRMIGPRPCRKCRTCGRLIVGSAPPFYFLRKETRNAPIVSTANGRLFAREDVAQSINWSRFPDIRLNLVAVHDHPPDNFRIPGDPDWQESHSPRAKPATMFRIEAGFDDELECHPPSVRLVKPWPARICRRCHSVDVARFAKPPQFALKELPQRRPPVAWQQIEGVRCLIFHSQLVDAIRKGLDDYVIGDVKVKGRRLGDYHTVFAAPNLRLSPGTKSTRKCALCGSPFAGYGHGPDGMSSQLTDLPLVAQDWEGHLLVHEGLYNTVQRLSLLGLHLQRVSVQVKRISATKPGGWHRGRAGWPESRATEVLALEDFGAEP